MNFYNCYECGNVPPKPETIMQKYDCTICGGRKCNIHTDINTNFTCSECRQDKLCGNCLAFGKCCYNYNNGKFVKK